MTATDVDLTVLNPVPLEDASGWVRALATTFLGNPYDDDFARRVARWSSEWLPERTWGVRERGRWVATLATEPRTVTVPGRDGSTVDLEADALTGVTVAATHRRRGLLRRMIGQSLQRAKDAGDPFSVLIAAEWPIYGRYGYAPATWCANYSYFPRQRHAAVAPVTADSVRQVEPDELAPLAPAIFDRARRLRAGQVDRRNSWWERRLNQPPYEPMSGHQLHWFVHESGGEPDGILAWRPGRDFDLEGSMGSVQVKEFVAATDAAYQDFWAYLAGIDVVDEIEWPGAAVDEPLRWLPADGRALRENYRGDLTWLRLLDVPAALSARGYACAGDVVLEVVDDDFGGYAAGRYRLSADEAGASCTPTTDPAELVVPQRALASMYLGGTSLRQLAVTGRVEQHRPGTMARVDAMFATPVLPYNATGF